MDAENRPFVTVEEDILDGVPQTKWVKTVKENLLKKFPNGVIVGNNQIRSNDKSRREMTFSEYSKWLSKKDPSVYADKFRATNNADEILRASTDWINEGLNHPRQDNIQDFARGKIQLRIGQNDYTADVVVGTTSGGNMLLYDILNIRRTSIKERSRHTVRSSQTEDHRSGASASADSIDQSGTEVKEKYSLDEEEDIPESAKEYAELERRRQEEIKPVIAKQNLRGSLMETFSTPEGRRAEMGGIIDHYADKILTEGALTQKDRDTLFDRMYAEGMMTVPADPFRQEARQAGSRRSAEKTACAFGANSVK